MNDPPFLVYEISNQLTVFVFVLFALAWIGLLCSLPATPMCPDYRVLSMVGLVPLTWMMQIANSQMMMGLYAQMGMLNIVVSDILMLLNYDCFPNFIVF